MWAALNEGPRLGVLGTAAEIVDVNQEAMRCEIVKAYLHTNTGWLLTFDTPRFLRK
jgi:hypothetical protein